MLKSLISKTILIAYCCISSSPVTGSVLCFEKDGKIEIEETCNNHNTASSVTHFQASSKNNTLNEQFNSFDHCGSCFDIPINRIKAYKRLFNKVLDELYVVISSTLFNLGRPKQSLSTFHACVKDSSAISILENVVLRI